jgi:hypothetical protein
VNKEKKDTQMPEIAKGTYSHGPHEMTDKNKTNRNGTQQVKVCQIAIRFTLLFNS